MWKSKFSGVFEAAAQPIDYVCGEQLLPVGNL